MGLHKILPFVPFSTVKSSAVRNNSPLMFNLHFTKKRLRRIIKYYRNRRITKKIKRIRRIRKNLKGIRGIRKAYKRI